MIINVSQLITKFLRNLFNQKEPLNSFDNNCLHNTTIKISLADIKDTYDGNVEIIKPLIEEIKHKGFPPVILIVDKVKINGNFSDVYYPIPGQAFLVQAAKMAYATQNLKEIFLQCAELNSKSGEVFKTYATICGFLEKEKYKKRIESYKFQQKLKEFTELIRGLEIEQ